MDMKESCFKHKGHLQDTLRRTKDYSLTYCTSPEKAYVIEPHEGELDYDLAYTNPTKFLDDFVEQDITKHKVRENKEIGAENAKKDAQAKAENKLSPKRSKVPLQTYTKVTKRKIGKIVGVVTVAISKLVRKRTGFSDLEVKAAMSSSEVKGIV
jgi:hypothetical protein